MKLTGTIRTADAYKAARKVANDLAKLDANHDGAITASELKAGEKRLKLDAAEKRVISKVLSNAFETRGSVWASTIASIYSGEKLGALDPNHSGKVRAQDLSKIQAPAGEGPKGIDQITKRLAPDFFEYVQAEEKAGKKF